jgi:protein SCO1/2
MVTATEGNGGEDDFVHTEKFALIDKHRHIRGYYDGTSEQEINQLMYDMEQLLKEE